MSDGIDHQEGPGAAIHDRQCREGRRVGACSGIGASLAGVDRQRHPVPRRRVRPEPRDRVGLAHPVDVDDQPELVRRRPRRTPPRRAAARSRRGPARSGVRRPRRAGADLRGRQQPDRAGTLEHPGVAEEQRGLRRRPAPATPRRCRPAARSGRPRITASRSATAKASSWSWVTISAVVPASRRMSRRSAASRSRSPASSAESGSSSSSSRGCDGERARQRHPLPLAAGQGRRAAGRRTPRGRRARAAHATRSADRGVRRSRSA